MEKKVIKILNATFLVLLMNILFFTTTSIYNKDNDGYLNLLDELELLKYEKLRSELNERAIYSKLLSVINEHDKIPTLSPINSKDIVRISSYYGLRTHPVYLTPIFHRGIDLSAIPNTNVYSTITGVVDTIRYNVADDFGLGNYVTIANDLGYVTIYGHLSDSIIVNIGDTVIKGDIIGFVGNSGLSTGYHLHYEIHENERNIDPLTYLNNYIINNTYVSNVNN